MKQSEIKAASIRARKARDTGGSAKDAMSSKKSAWSGISKGSKGGLWEDAKRSKLISGLWNDAKRTLSKKIK